jgi:hypothetical protein
MKACMSPGPIRWSNFCWPRTIVASLRARAGRSETRDVGLPARTSRVRNSARRPNSAAATATATTSATVEATLAVVLSPRLPS